MTVYCLSLSLSYYLFNQRFPAITDFMETAGCNVRLKEIGELIRCKRAYCNESESSSACSVWLYFTLIIIYSILK